MIIEFSITPQTLNMRKQRTTSAASINLDISRKFTKYSLENILIKAVFIVTVFEILLFERRSVFAPAQRGAEGERVNFSVKNQKKCSAFVEIACEMIDSQA